MYIEKDLVKEIDILVKQGVTFDRTLYIRYASNNAPFDLTGYETKGQIRISAEDNVSPIVAEFTTTILSPSTDGKIQLLIPASVTKSLDFDIAYAYSVLIRSIASPEDTTKEVLMGTVHLSLDVAEF